MKPKLLTLLFVLSYLFSKAQSSPPELASPAPASPNAASLGKFGEIPVNLGTGIPNVSIPVYTITTGKIALPITLNYHAGGIKVEEIASWAGLGWSLNAGGVITRVCRGMPDEEPSGFKNQGYLVKQLNSMTTTQKEDYLQNIEFRIVDAEPDIFYYNFGGYSGKFFFLNNGDISCMPQAGFKISYIESPQHGWEIITPDGTKYLFNAVEVTTTTGADEGNPVELETSWYLKQITDIYNNTVQCFYEDEEYSFFTQGQETARLMVNTGGNVQTYTPPASLPRLLNQIQGKRLIKISFTNGEVNFIPSAQSRLDLSTFSLAKVQIKNATAILKEFSLTYGYFNDGETAATNKRLRLDAIIETSGVQEGAKHLFEYNTMALPNRLSSSQDHWGFYNGISNLSLLGIVTNNGTQVGANREPNSNATPMGILKKITYPTGGTSEFEFENNTVQEHVPSHYGEFVPVYTLEAHNYNNFTETDLWFQQSITVTSAHIDPLTSTADFTIGIGEAIGENPFERTYYISYFIYDQSNTLVWSGNKNSDGGSITLPLGTYAMKTHISLDEAGVPEIYCGFRLGQRPYIPEEYITKLAAGLRVKKITNKTYPAATPEIKAFKYNKFGQALTSGNYGRKPEYYYLINMNFPDPVLAHTWNSYPGIFASSTSNYPLASSNGSHVDYQNVTTELGENAELGKIENTFTGFADWPDMHYSGFPFPPPTSREYHRGLPLLETKYRKTSTGFAKVSEEEFNYQFSRSNPVDNVTKESEGLKLGRSILGDWSCCTDYMFGLEWQFYMTESEFFYLKTKKIRAYTKANSTDYLETVTEYEHSPIHFQPIQVMTTDSKGTQLKVVSKYPHDLQSTPTPNVYNDMVARHIWSPIIEEETYKNTNTFLKAAKTNYNWYNGSWGVSGTSSLILPQTIESKTLSGSYQVKGRYHSYDAKGNLTSLSKDNGAEKVFIWGYNGAYPIAEVSGVSYTNAIGVLNTTILNTPASDVQLLTELNKIRTNFPYAIVQAFTYNPLLGVTSQSDANNRVSYYEYDNWGRLYIVRDHTNNILKKICYNYQGQPVNCQ